MREKAVSPIVSTVLLMMIVVILAIIILVWFQGFFKEAVTKEINQVEKRADKYCTEVGLTPFINDDLDRSFGFRNSGNVPIYSVNLKLSYSSGNSEIKKIGANDGGSVNPGFATTLKDPVSGNYFKYDDYEKIEIIPILLGQTKKGGVQQFTCPETSGIVV